MAMNVLVGYIRRNAIIIGNTMFKEKDRVLHKVKKKRGIVSEVTKLSVAVDWGDGYESFMHPDDAIAIIRKTDSQTNLDKVSVK
jgi:hypothetical protein